ncbi:MAG TPA: hypothetical protein VFG83_12095 [Kofleriaceae bacterium]|nr:hypothetical protein [Kofleriaceae bacterium]
MTILWEAAADPELLALRRQGSPEPVDVDITTVEISARSFVLVTLTPTTLLEAGATYELVMPIREEPLTQFSVGDLVDDTVQSAPQLDAMDLQAMSLEDAPVRNSCTETPGGFFERVTLHGATISKDAEYAILALGPRGEAPVRVALMRPRISDSTIELRSRTCSPRLPAILPGTTYCAQLVTYDIAGRAQMSTAVCAVAVECATDVDDNGNPSDVCAPVEPEPDGGMTTDSGGCTVTAGGATGTTIPGLAILLAASIFALARWLPMQVSCRTSRYSRRTWSRRS